MAFQPSHDDVDSFLSIVGVDMSRSEVIARLKGNRNNVGQALNEYYENLDAPNKYTWDEGAFGADRDGGLLSTQGPEFNIQSPDETEPFGGRFDGGPSRPPSRISNNRSPLGKIIDLTAQAAAADPSTSMTYDDDLEKAIAASRVDAGLPPQETGITSTNGTDQVFFGPANRTQYEPGKWDLVPTGKTYAQEILLDPEPAERKRDIGAPAFLKPGIEDHRLGALLTIYHGIPLLRSIFLSRMNVLPTYGHNNEWWSGKVIELQTITGHFDAESELRQELQRLMAFLDKTDRSYGSADALANLHAVKEKMRHGKNTEETTVEGAVLKAYKDVLEHEGLANSVTKIYSVGVDGLAQTSSEEFAILRLDLPNQNSDQETIYDIADAVLWNLNPLELPNSPYLSHVAEVVTFRLEGDVFSKGVEVPAVWYPDRYLQSGGEAALDMRVKKQEVKDELHQLERIEKFLTDYSLPGGKSIKVKDLFKTTLQHDVNQTTTIGSTVETQDIDAMDECAIPAQQSGRARNLSAQLRKLTDSIDRKLLSLNQEKEKAKDALRQLSKLYTEPSDDPLQPALHRYTLRGVSASKNTIYICKQAETELKDLELENPSTQKSDQWWRINYATSGANPITVEKTTEERVLEVARTYKSEDGICLLVYASDKAMSYRHDTLSKPLETFVRYDNALFRSEFPSEIASPKRKSDEMSNGSDDAQEPVRWNGGASGSSRGRENSISIIEKEIEASECGVDRNMIIGMDPSMNATPDSSNTGPEMQERSGARMLSSRPKMSVERLTTIDSMDLDQIVGDENVAEESTAVRRVGFTE